MKEGSGNREHSFDDPEFVELVKQVQHEMATALPKPDDESPPIYVPDCDGFLVGEHIKPVQWEAYYDTGLCARLGLYCYNFQNGTNYRFKFLKQCYERFGSDLTKMFITLEAMNPKRLPFRRSPLTLETCVQFAGFSHRTLSWWETCVCRLQGSEEADHVWNHDAINDHYKSELPNWWSPDQHHRYKVQELLDLDHWWLHLFTEFAFFSKWSEALRPADIADSLPLKTQKMVVETRGEAALEPREMLKAPNGKPGHMRLEARCWTIPESQDQISHGKEASSSGLGIGVSRASTSVQKDKKRRREDLRRELLGDDFDSQEDDSHLINDPNLAYGFDLDFSSDGPVTLVKSKWGVDYEIDLNARLGLHCYNFHKGTNYKFLRWEKYNPVYFSMYVTFEAIDPSSPKPISFQTLLNFPSCPGDVFTWRTFACRIKCNMALNDCWDKTAIDPFYQSEMPQWLPNGPSNTKYYYVVQESEIQENEWLHLFTEIAFFLKENPNSDDPPPLVIKKVVVQTKEEYKSEPREKLKAENALFYISYEYNAMDCRAIVRKTMGGKPGHMCLDVTDRTEEKEEAA